MSKTSPAHSDDSEETVDLKDLKNKSIKGGAVTLASQGASICIRLLSTVVLARLLTPEDYGIIAMVMAITTFAGIFRDLGLSSATVQKKNLTHAQSSNLFWINVLTGGLLTLLVALSSPLVAWFYGKPELFWVTIALSSNFLISSLSAQHDARLVRAMQFGRKSVATIAGALATLLLAVILAMCGFSYWALVWGTLFGSAITTSLLIVLSPFKPRGLSRKSGVREMLKFGAHITAFDLINYFSRNLDTILLGRVWGAASLGLYNRAYGLMIMPITTIRGPINAVAFPALSRLQKDSEAFRQYFLKITQIIAWLSMPLAGFLFVAASPVIELVLGEQWLECAPIFSWLALLAFIQPTTGFIGSLMLSLGQGRRYLQCGMISATLAISAYCIGVLWGPMGMAIACVVSCYAGTYPLLWWGLRESPVSVGDYMKVCLDPVLTVLVSVLFAHLIKEEISDFSLFGQIVALGIAVFIPLLIRATYSRRDILRHGQKLWVGLFRARPSA